VRRTLSFLFVPRRRDLYVTLRSDFFDGTHRHSRAWRMLAEGAGTMNELQSMSTELDHLRIRVIALENLVISLLSQAERPRALGRELATFISPRPGFTQHTSTLAAAAEMVHLVERAQHFQDWVEGRPLS